MLHDSLRLRFSSLLTLTALLFITLVTPVVAQKHNQPPKGFTALFNGRDIKEWTGGATRDPREIAALSPEERAKWDADMKKGIDEHWKVENGDLVSDGKDPFLATTRDYGDFEMWVDWKIKTLGDSGIYLRGTPQVQIWDTSDKKVIPLGADKGSGGIWNNKKHERNPSQLADKPLGKWNRMYIRMVGPYVTVRLNGKKVVDNVVMDNYYDPNIPVFIRGPIYLQTHGNVTRFRNVFIREIPPGQANRMLAKIGADDKEFQSLFNGKDLAGWASANDDYEVKGGGIRVKKDRHGNLLTEDTFDNFVMRFEFKLPPGGNNGLAIRAPLSNDELAYLGMELQVIDNTAPQYADLHDYQFHGSLYGMAPALKGYLRPVGQWNFEEVTVDGDHITVHVNGFEILNVKLEDVRKQPIDGKEHPGAFRTEGHVGFCGHNDPVTFRNIRIKRLPAKTQLASRGVPAPDGTAAAAPDQSQVSKKPAQEWDSQQPTRRLFPRQRLFSRIRNRAR